MCGFLIFVLLLATFWIPCRRLRRYLVECVGRVEVFRVIRFFHSHFSNLFSPRHDLVHNWHDRQNWKPTSVHDRLLHPGQTARDQPFWLHFRTMRAQRYRSPCLPQLRYKTISLGGCDKKPLTRNKELDDDKTKAIDIIPTLGGGKMLEVSKQRADTFKESGLMTQSEHASHDFLCIWSPAGEYMRRFIYIFVQEEAVDRIRGYGDNRSKTLTGRPDATASDFDNNNCIRAGPGSGWHFFYEGQHL